jgi:hypothetical protein
MSEPKPASPFFADCEDYLAQGDIFRLELVLPMPDTQKRIFRTPEGRHGKLVLEAGGGYAFSESDLLQTLESLPLEDRLLPFQRTPDGDYELVIVAADLLRHFIVVSQTCDISGVDSPASPLCVIARVMTIAEFCRTEKVPFPSAATGAEKTIVTFLAERLGEHIKQEAENDLTFPDYLRKALDDWKAKDTRESPDARIRGAIKTLLNNIVGNKQLNTYYLHPDAARGGPESFVEFSYLFTVRTGLLIEHQGSRIATLSSPYREEFAQRFAHYYMRIATPVPHRGEKF